MKNILYVLLIVSFTACNEKKQTTAQAYTTTPNGLAGLQKPTSTTAAQTTATNTNNNSSNLLTNPPHGEPGHDCSIAVGAPLKATTSATPQANVQTITPQQTANAISTQQVSAPVASKGQNLNPAHGQPNHRCDIAVGAPLNSKPAQNTTTTVKPQVTVQQPTTQASSQVPLLNEKGQRLNPAHGQPGHKCEIAVGAPLTN